MHLQKIDMEQCKADPCVFRKVVDDVVTLIACVHVDDLAVTAKDQETEGVMKMTQTVFVDSLVGRLDMQYET